MEYSVIFDEIQSGYRHWWFPAAGLVFVMVGTALFGFRNELPHRTPSFFPHLFLSFSILWTSVAFLGTAAGHFRLSNALRDGTCEVVEGVITHFHPMPANGKGKESFYVAGKRFEYSDYFVSPGFNQSSTRGGPLREGLAVRIHCVGDDIARLEIAR